MTLARTIMIQGTASSVGKSIVTTALCRWFARQGYRVAPFKAQNMALNAAVTPDGKEIGRAQAVQADAARSRARVEMNPILLKPMPNARAQVVVLGEPVGVLSAADYGTTRSAHRQIVLDSLATLRQDYDVVVIEGAGSPAEVNLRASDIANMFVAHAADAPVLLVGDIDRGGVFASLVGTLELLPSEDRARVRGFLINKFRGDRGLLTPGLSFLEERTGVPTLGVLPYVRDIGVAEEDSVALELRRRPRRAAPDELDIAVVSLPSMSNYDDFLPLERSPKVAVRYVESPYQVGRADLVILPGSKATISDLDWLRDAGFPGLLHERAAAGGYILGICGGCQMLGQAIDDVAGVESAKAGEHGIGLLPIVTTFETTKRTTQTRARAQRNSWLAASGSVVCGYEIHMGRTRALEPGAVQFSVVSRNGATSQELDGAVSPNGAVIGTMLHGLFDNEELLRGLLSRLRLLRGLPPPAPESHPPADVYDRLADVIEANVDVKVLRALTFGATES